HLPSDFLRSRGNATKSAICLTTGEKKAKSRRACRLPVMSPLRHKSHKSGTTQGRLETPPPAPPPRSGVGEQRVFLPLSVAGRGLGGGVVRQPFRGTP